MTDISELVLIMKLDLHRAVGNFNPEIKVKTVYLQRIVEALVSAQARIAELEARTVIVPGTKCIGWLREEIKKHDEKWKASLSAVGIKWESE